MDEELWPSWKLVVPRELGTLLGRLSRGGSSSAYSSKVFQVDHGSVVADNQAESNEQQQVLE